MLIKTDQDIIKSYLEDYSNLKGGFANAVYMPENESEIVDILKKAAKDKTPVTISGAGTGVTGGRIPFGGIVLSLEKLNKIISIKKLKDGGLAHVQSGVLLKDFLETIEKENFFYPPDPTEKASCLGGNIATGASGARTFKFGTIRDFVEGLKIVLSTGDIVDIKRGKIFAVNNVLTIPLESGKDISIPIPTYKMPDIKNAAGYYSKPDMDAIDLFIGQDGTLGVIAGAHLRLLDKPHDIFNCYAFFSKDKNCMDFISDAKHDMDAMSLEYVDKNALDLIRGKHPNIPESAESACFFEQVVKKDNADILIEKWSKLMQKHEVDLNKTWFGQTKKERQRFHDFRHDIPDAVNEILKQTNQIKIGTDLAVPDNRLSQMFAFYKKRVCQSGIKYLIFGHIGNNHLHVNMLPKNQKESKQAGDIYIELVEKAISLGGTVSAEHGIGKIKHKYLKSMYGAFGISEMVKVKKALDPACILGHNNIFSKELLML